jgi:hypothetical protein
MLKLEHLKTRAMQLGLYINHHNNRYSVGVYNDFHADNSTFCALSKREIDVFLTGVAYQLFYAPTAPTQSTAQHAANTESTNSTH